MSLIGEALKRARQEAAYQEAAREGRTWGPPPAYTAPQAKTWPLLAAGVAAGALLVAALAGGLYWLVGRDSRQAAQVAIEAEGPAADGEARDQRPADAGAPEGSAGGAESSSATGTGPLAGSGGAGAGPRGRDEAERGPGAAAAGAPDGGRSGRDAAGPGAEDRAARPDAGAGRTPGGAAGAPEAESPARAPAAPTTREAAPSRTGSPATAAPETGETGVPRAPREPSLATGSPEAGAPGSEREAGTRAQPGTAGSGTPAGTEPRPATPAPVPRREETGPSRREEAASGGEPQTYVGEAPLPDGGKLELTGIADSTDQPVALINGRVMGPGESIEGYTLVRIGDGQVELRGHGTTVFLRLR